MNKTASINSRTAPSRRTPGAQGRAECPTGTRRSTPTGRTTTRIRWPSASSIELALGHRILVVVLPVGVDLLVPVGHSARPWAPGVLLDGAVLELMEAVLFMVLTV